MHQIQNLNVSRLVFAVVFVRYTEARCWVENEDVVGAAPTGDDPTTSEWSTIVLPPKVQLILEVWQYVTIYCLSNMRHHYDISYIQDYVNKLGKSAKCQFPKLAEAEWHIYASVI